MNKINVEEILKKHLGSSYEDEIQSAAHTAAIKEIVEAVVDKCEEDATISRDGGWITAREHGNVDGGTYTINKQSILQVKEQVDYS